MKKQQTTKLNFKKIFFLLIFLFIFIFININTTKQWKLDSNFQKLINQNSTNFKYILIKDKKNNFKLYFKINKEFIYLFNKKTNNWTEIENKLKEHILKLNESFEKQPWNSTNFKYILLKFSLKFGSINKIVILSKDLKNLYKKFDKDLKELKNQQSNDFKYVLIRDLINNKFKLLSKNKEKQYWKLNESFEKQPWNSTNFKYILIKDKNNEFKLFSKNFENSTNFLFKETNTDWKTIKNKLKEHIFKIKLQIFNLQFFIIKNKKNLFKVYSKDLKKLNKNKILKINKNLKELTNQNLNDFEYIILKTNIFIMFLSKNFKHLFILYYEKNTDLENWKLIFKNTVFKLNERFEKQPWNSTNFKYILIKNIKKEFKIFSKNFEKQYWKVNESFEKQDWDSEDYEYILIKDKNNEFKLFSEGLTKEHIKLNESFEKQPWNLKDYKYILWKYKNNEFKLFSKNKEEQYWKLNERFEKQPWNSTNFKYILIKYIYEYKTIIFSKNKEKQYWKLNESFEKQPWNSKNYKYILIRNQKIEYKLFSEGFTKEHIKLNENFEKQDWDSEDYKYILIKDKNNKFKFLSKNKEEQYWKLNERFEKQPWNSTNFKYILIKDKNNEFKLLSKNFENSTNFLFTEIDTDWKTIKQKLKNQLWKLNESFEKQPWNSTNFKYILIKDKNNNFKIFYKNLVLNKTTFFFIINNKIITINIKNENFIEQFINLLKTKKIKTLQKLIKKLKKINIDKEKLLINLNDKNLIQILLNIYKWNKYLNKPNQKPWKIFYNKHIFNKQFWLNFILKKQYSDIEKENLRDLINKNSYFSKFINFLLVNRNLTEEKFYKKLSNTNLKTYKKTYEIKDSLNLDFIIEIEKNTEKVLKLTLYNINKSLYENFIIEQKTKNNQNVFNLKKLNETLKINIEKNETEQQNYIMFDLKNKILYWNNTNKKITFWLETEKIDKFKKLEQEQIKNMVFIWKDKFINILEIETKKQDLFYFKIENDKNWNQTKKPTEKKHSLIEKLKETRIFEVLKTNQKINQNYKFIIKLNNQFFILVYQNQNKLDLKIIKFNKSIHSYFKKNNEIKNENEIQFDKNINLSMFKNIEFLLNLENLNTINEFLKNNKENYENILFVDNLNENLKIKIKLKEKTIQKTKIIIKEHIFIFDLTKINKEEKTNIIEVNKLIEKYKNLNKFKDINILSNFFLTNLEKDLITIKEIKTILFLEKVNFRFLTNEKTKEKILKSFFNYKEILSKITQKNFDFYYLTLKKLKKEFLIITSKNQTLIYQVINNKTKKNIIKIENESFYNYFLNLQSKKNQIEHRKKNWKTFTFWKNELNWEKNNYYKFLEILYLFKEENKKLFENSNWLEIKYFISLNKQQILNSKTEKQKIIKNIIEQLNKKTDTKKIDYKKIKIINYNTLYDIFKDNETYLNIIIELKEILYKQNIEQNLKKFYKKYIIEIEKIIKEIKNNSNENIKNLKKFLSQISSKKQIELDLSKLKENEIFFFYLSLKEQNISKKKIYTKYKNESLIKDYKNNILFIFSNKIYIKKSKEDINLNFFFTDQKLTEIKYKENYRYFLCTINSKNLYISIIDFFIERFNINSYINSKDKIKKYEKDYSNFITIQKIEYINSNKKQNYLINNIEEKIEWIDFKSIVNLYTFNNKKNILTKLNLEIYQINKYSLYENYILLEIIELNKDKKKIKDFFYLLLSKDFKKIYITNEKQFRKPNLDKVSFKETKQKPKQQKIENKNLKYIETKNLNKQTLKLVKIKNFEKLIYKLTKKTIKEKSKNISNELEKLKILINTLKNSKNLHNFIEKNKNYFKIKINEMNFFKYFETEKENIKENIQHFFKWYIKTYFKKPTKENLNQFELDFEKISNFITRTQNNSYFTRENYIKYNFIVLFLKTYKEYKKNKEKLQENINDFKNDIIKTFILTFINYLLSNKTTINLKINDKNWNHLEKEFETFSNKKNNKSFRLGYKLFYSIKCWFFTLKIPKIQNWIMYWFTVILMLFLTINYLIIFLQDKMVSIIQKVSFMLFKTDKIVNIIFSVLLFFVLFSVIISCIKYLIVLRYINSNREKLSENHIRNLKTNSLYFGFNISLYIIYFFILITCLTSLKNLIDKILFLIFKVKSNINDLNYQIGYLVNTNIQSEIDWIKNQSFNLETWDKTLNDFESKKYNSMIGLIPSFLCLNINILTTILIILVFSNLVKMIVLESKKFFQKNIISNFSLWKNIIINTFKTLKNYFIIVIVNSIIFLVIIKLLLVYQNQNVSSFIIGFLVLILLLLFLILLNLLLVKLLKTEIESLTNQKISMSKTIKPF